ncbi:MAG: DNA topoisomerase III [Desulfobulbaceae bacterium]|uniref:DNA topoisomerase n=1 Tax=Candidatus Desulfatifera sulfidica TaxID=2841691 RepID=A0A8J6NAB0_9BACT|nr:DNA topoisomerase III [Candidatus Desulfatifera sulfidica]
MANKTLVIAEKPSVAGDLAKVLPGKFTKNKTHYESDSYIVSFAIGHLVTIQYPEEMDERHKKWHMENLPIMPEEFQLKGLDRTMPQLNTLQKLIRRRDVTEIINACDAGREGELIFKYILRYVWNSSVAKKSFKRLWLQSMTTQAIKNGFANLRDNDEMLPLEEAALCRSESDWLIGINATRAMTSYNSRRGGFFLTPCGRVQTPTLSLIVKRERARQAFIPQTYFNLLATFTNNGNSYEGKWIDTGFKKTKEDSHARADRLWQNDQAQRILELCSGKPATIDETSQKSSQGAPQLYDLTSLQREANSRFGFSAKNTLGLAQSLYEQHKALTYPRTDSRCLPEDYIATVNETVNAQGTWDYGRFAEAIIKQNLIKANTRIFNDKKISDHHAIIPTLVIPTKLSEPEMKIYTMVVQRFLAVFFPPARYLNTRRLSLVETETFLTEGKILTDPGWKALYGGELDQGTTLEAITKGADITCSKVTKEESETRPPARYNEATLLSAMENSDKLIEDEELADAMKERGLGTPATRAAIIEKLLNEKYLVREGKELVPTGKAFELLDLIWAMKIEVLSSPEMTGEWEYKLNQILHGKFTRAKFMAEIRKLTQSITDQIKNFSEESHTTEATFSPVNGQRILVTPTAYISEDKKISIRKVLGGRSMNDEEIASLFKGETLGPFSDFRSKQGKPFSASVQIKDNKVDFIFADSTDNLDLEAIRAQEPLGNSPVDNTPVYETPSAYFSDSALNGDRTNGLQISKIILSRAILPDHIRQLLSKGKTELITKFISKKKRPFDAYLLLDKKGKITFEFPPRKKRGTPTQEA